MKYLVLVATLLIVSLTGCDAINPASPKPTHTMEIIVSNVSSGVGHIYGSETVTIKATIDAITPLPNWEGKYILELRTGRLDIRFAVITSKDTYKAKETYTLTIYINDVWYSQDLERYTIESELVE